MARLKTTTKWRKTLHWLRAQYPASHLVRVQRKPRPRRTKELCGFCEFDDDHSEYHIYVDLRQVWALQIDTLLHEWAHALTWHGNDDDDHGPEWGLAYAMLYRAFLVWNYGRPAEEEEELVLAS